MAYKHNEESLFIIPDPYLYDRLTIVVTTTTTTTASDKGSGSFAIVTGLENSGTSITSEFRLGIFGLYRKLAT